MFPQTRKLQVPMAWIWSRDFSITLPFLKRVSPPRTTSICSIFSYRLLIWLWIWQGLSYWPPISRLDCQGCFQIWGRLEFVQPPPTNRCHLQQKQPCTRLAYKWQFGFPAEKRSKNKENWNSKKIWITGWSLSDQRNILTSNPKHVNRFLFELHF